MGDWTRKGPLEPPAPSRGGRGPSDFAERRPPRDPPAEAKPPRDLNWGERRGPLAPLPQEEGGPGSRDASRQRPAPEGMGERSESYRGNRRQAPPAWGEGRPEGARREYTERPERPEKPERTPTAADKDMQWRDRMRPDAAAAQPQDPAKEASAPSSPAPQAAAPVPASRPKLNLQKRTVSEATDAASPSVASESKPSPFGGARPIDTATREKEVEEKRQQAIREKREADEKAKEERRLAKEAAKAEEESKAEEDKAATADGAAATEAGEGVKPSEEEAQTTKPEAEGDNAAQQNGASAEQKVPVRPREPREGAANPKPRGFDGGNWRSSGDQRGPRGAPSGPRGGRGGGAPRGARNEGRGGRANGPSGQQQAPTSPSEPETPTQDEDGWTTVPKKGRQGRPVAS